MPLFKHRQELPLAAFFTPIEAASLLDRDDRSILVLSHCWNTAAHPDPAGSTFQALRGYLSSQPAAQACGIFIGTCAVTRTPCPAHPRSEMTASGRSALVGRFHVAPPEGPFERQAHRRRGGGVLAGTEGDGALLRKVTQARAAIARVPRHMLAAARVAPFGSAVPSFAVSRARVSCSSRTRVSNGHTTCVVGRALSRGPALRWLRTSPQQSGRDRSRSVSSSRRRVAPR